MTGTKKTIWKYPLRVADHQVVDMPKGAEILKIMVQNNQLCLWTIVTDSVEAENEAREFEIIGTGNPMPDIVEERDYLGSVIMGPFVWHVFEVLP